MRATASMRTLAAVLTGVLVAACGGASAATTAPPAAPLHASLALINGRLIDGTGAAPVSKAVVLIDGDRIVALGTADSLAVPAGTKTIDLAGATILPGFINAHVHYAFDAVKLAAWAKGGVTTVRDESAAPADISKLKTFQASVQKDPHNARLVSAGSMMAAPGGYGQLFVNSPEEARQAVLAELADGVTAVKVAIETGYGGVRGLPLLTPEELKVIADAAHANGLRVSGHITSGLYMRQLLDADVDDIAHLPYDILSPDDAQAMADRNVYLVPTFTVFRNSGVPMEVCLQNLEVVLAAGGKVAMGNDYGGSAGDFELGMPMYEIEMMAQAGMTPMQVIQAGTLNAAHVIGMEKELGTVERGKVADLLIVAGDPLANLQSLGEARLVIHNGVIIRDETAH
jgi:imidazolonepropionase-like amidohydrolase